MIYSGEPIIEGANAAKTHPWIKLMRMGHYIIVSWKAIQVPSLQDDSAQTTHVNNIKNQARTIMEFEDEDKTK